MNEPEPNIPALERRIADGDEQAMRLYTKDAFLNHIDSKKEFHRRRTVLVRTLLEAKTVTPFVCLAKLSAFVDDVDGWGSFVERVEDVEPGVGFFLGTRSGVFQRMMLIAKSGCLRLSGQPKMVTFRRGCCSQNANMNQLHFLGVQLQKSN